MSWLFPGFLAGALLLGVPIALHFLRSKPRVNIPFPTLRFLGPTALRETKRNEIRRWLTLLLRCLLILLLAAAFSRPFWTLFENSKRHAYVLAIDNSMSMQAEGRWPELRQWAQEKISNLKPGDRIGILLMNPSPSWLLPLGEDALPERAQSLLRDFVPGYETTRYEPALHFAVDALSQNPASQKTLLWVADGQRTGWIGFNFKTALPGGMEILIPPPAAPPRSQAAINLAEIEPSGSKANVKVTVKLYQPGPMQRILRVYSGSTLLSEKNVTLEGSGPATFSCPVTLPDVPAAYPLRISLEANDSLAADDFYYLPLPGADTKGVLADQSSGVDFLSHALHATRRLASGSIQTRPLPGKDKEWPPGSLVILRSPASFEKSSVTELNRFLEKGGSAWILLEGSPGQLAWLKSRGVTATPLIGPPSQNSNEALVHTLENWDLEHPLLKPFTEDSLLPLMEIEFKKGWALEAENSERIASWEQGAAAVIELPAGPGRLLVCGFSFTPGDTNWVQHPTFLPFVHQAAQWLSSAVTMKSNWTVGENIVLPQNGSWKQLEGPVKVPDAQVGTSVAAHIPGIYQFTPTTPEAVSRYYTINVPPEESDLTPWPEPLDFQTLAASAQLQTGKKAPTTQPIQRLSQEASESQQRMWWWLLAFALFSLLAEVCLANRSTP